jgi:riboflavin biosynthesis pyrimidine reductase
MAVVATLVVGADGSTSKEGRSSGVTSSADRSSFLARRRKADCILIGGATARVEPYQRTPVPVVVTSRSMINALANNRQAHWWNLSPLDALKKAKTAFGENILVEAGSSIITTLLDARAIDSLELSVTDITGGEGRVNIEDLLNNFSHVEKNTIDKTVFYTATLPKSHP